MAMSRTFARLEDCDAGQVLMTMLRDEDEQGRSGPVISIMVSEHHGMQPQVCFGPFPDTDAGWDAATNILEKSNLQKMAADLVEKIDAAFGKAGVE